MRDLQWCSLWPSKFSGFFLDSELRKENTVNLVRVPVQPQVLGGRWNGILVWRQYLFLFTLMLVQRRGTP